MTGFKLKKNYGQLVVFFLINWLNRLVRLLTLRKSRKFWGVVYDSVTKQPLDPVIVKLLYAHNGEPVETCVSDLAGRYGFLAKPGKFKIFARKTNYIFPSRRVKDKDDGIFTDVYRGEFFELYRESEVIGPNIPMDPVSPDWNQQAKLKVLNTFPFLKLFLRKLASVTFWFFFLYSLSVQLSLFYRTLAFDTGNIHFKIMLAYFGLFFLNYILPEVRLWGRLYDAKSKKPISGARLELNNPELPGISLAKAQSQEGGRFLLRANPGIYRLKVTYEGQSAEIAVKIYDEGVLNLDFGVLWTT